MAEVEKPGASETAPPDRLAAMFDRTAAKLGEVC